MLDVSILLDKIEGTRLTRKVGEGQELTYNLNVGLSERERDPTSLFLSFNLELRSHPPVAKILISGSATLKGTGQEIQAETGSPDQGTPPGILLTIYESLYGLIYLVAGNLKVAPPMPNLLRKGAQVKVEVAPERTERPLE